MNLKVTLATVLMGVCLFASLSVAADTAPAPKQPATAQPAPTAASSEKGAVAPRAVKAPVAKEIAAVPAGGRYVLGPGDVLDISVWKDEALTRSVVVLPDGRITFPLVGEIEAGGKTVAEIKEELEKKLVRYVPDLVLSVEVKQVNSMLIYVIGRVNAPGRFLLNTNVNVLQALSMAGGLNPFAEKDRIKIYRYQEGKPVVLSFRYNDLAEKNVMDQNVWLKQGDVILVP